MKIILNPKNWKDHLILKWNQIKTDFNGPISIKVERIPYEEPQYYGKITFHSSEKVTPIFKWYRFSFLVTRRFYEDFGEGLINQGFPTRFKRGWHDFDRDCWIWYLIPFHIIIPACKLFRIWFFWECVDSIERKQLEIDKAAALKEKMWDESRKYAHEYYYQTYKDKQPLIIVMPSNGN